MPYYIYEWIEMIEMTVYLQIDLLMNEGHSHQCYTQNVSNDCCQ